VEEERPLSGDRRASGLFFSDTRHVYRAAPGVMIIGMDFAKRAARNEEIVRDVNRQIEEGAHLHEVAAEMPFHCECGQALCLEDRAECADDRNDTGENVDYCFCDHSRAKYQAFLRSGRTAQGSQELPGACCRPHTKAAPSPNNRLRRLRPVALVLDERLPRLLERRLDLERAIAPARAGSAAGRAPPVAT
jgi:hypothetical protein